MSISIDREYIKKVAQEMNFEVEFDSATPGIVDPNTGEVYDFVDVFLDSLEFSADDQV